MMRLHCFDCMESVSNELPEDTVVRAVLACPECYAKGAAEVAEMESEPHDIGWAVRQMMAGKQVRRASCPYMVFVFMDSADGPWLAQINGKQPPEAAMLRHRHLIATDWEIAE